jgi:hypothetical protein
MDFCAYVENFNSVLEVKHIAVISFVSYNDLPGLSTETIVGMTQRHLASLLVLAVFCTQLFAFEYATKCKKNEVLFLHRCFCEPGWESASSDPKVLDCSVPLMQIGKCDCEPNDAERSFLRNISWQHPLGYECQALCRYNSQVGVPRSLPVEWYDNQKWKQLPFYLKDLPKTVHPILKRD